MKRAVAYMVFMASITIPIFIGKAFAFPETMNGKIDHVLGKGASKLYEPVIRAFQEAVRQNDPVKISHFINYPIIVFLDRKKVYLRSKKDFIKYYSKIFTKKMRTIVINQDYETLFVTWQGVMFGDGYIWLSGVFPDPKSHNFIVKITAINMDSIVKD